jgi:O-antigen ligase
MNKIIQNLLLILMPFFPFWSWLSVTLTEKPVTVFVSIVLIPIAAYLLVYVNKKLPKYLIFLILFTLYHISSIFINNIFPPDSNKIYFFLSDPNILACLLFIIIEYTVFDEIFIKRMTKLILLIVIISMIVSLIQVKLPTFFFNLPIQKPLDFLAEKRCFSIYSWSSLNSLGISFPILIAILVSVYERKTFILPIVIIAGIVVSFLSRARYVMISGLVALSQLFFNKRTSIIKRISTIGLFIVLLVVINYAANESGFDINEVIEKRIMEKESDMSSARTRILSYQVFVTVFPENPWFGVGPETQKKVLDLLQGEAPIIHIGYLSYLYYYGVFGCLILFSAIFFLLRDAWLVGKRDNFWGAFYGLISFCLANLTFVYFNFSEMGIVISLIYLRYFNYQASLKYLNNLLIMNKLSQSDKTISLLRIT